MIEKRRVFALAAGMAFVVLISSVGFCLETDPLVSDWNDFLHYSAIGRFALAKGYAEKIIASSPDPEVLLDLSEENSAGYSLLLRVQTHNAELEEVSAKILAIIEEGRFIRRTHAKIIVENVRGLSKTARARMAAEQRLRNAGEYAIPLMLDALSDEGRQKEYPNIVRAMPKVGKGAIGPLVVALQMDNVAVKADVIRTLGSIGYPQSLGYLKYVMENDESQQLRDLAEQAMKNIDSSAIKVDAAELLFRLGQSYYDHAESLAAADYNFANIWFWDENVQGLVRQEVDKGYFNELMAMRACEWALKADPNAGKAIALWLAAFFKAESAGVEQPGYFGSGHADAMTYATTAGAEYLHQALDRALKEGNAYVALGIVEALVANAGEESLLYTLGVEQPLAKALRFGDRAVRYSAAIAIAGAGPKEGFIGSELVIKNLAEAIGDGGTEELGGELADSYALRAVNVMLQLAVGRNKIVDLSKGREALIAATKDERKQMQILAGKVLARLESPDAQRAIAEMALLEKNDKDIRIEAFDSLAVSAKQNARLVTAEQVDAIYSLVGSKETDAELRSAAAGAYGALNLPSSKVKDLILDQAKS